MPAPVLTAAAQMLCIHGGVVEIIPKNPTVLVGGMPALAEGDLIGSPIANCQLPVTGVTAPCTAIVSEIPLPGIGTSLSGMCGGRPFLLEGVQAITDSVPPGTAFVTFPGQVMVTA